jgi:hypothetical protein
VAAPVGNLIHMEAAFVRVLFVMHCIEHGCPCTYSRPDRHV